MVEPASPSINFKKVVENVISYLVTAVFVGACAIVWRGATTVDDRVHATEKSIQLLIDNLSAKLTSYEVQLEMQSNQLVSVYTELKNLKPVVALNAERQPRTNVYRADERVQRAIQQDIYQQLQKK